MLEAIRIAFGDVNFGANLLFMPELAELLIFATEPMDGIGLKESRTTSTFRKEKKLSKIFNFFVLIVMKLSYNYLNPCIVPVGNYYAYNSRYCATMNDICNSYICYILNLALVKSKIY